MTLLLMSFKILPNIMFQTHEPATQEAHCSEISSGLTGINEHKNRRLSLVAGR